MFSFFIRNITYIMAIITFLLIFIFTFPNVVEIFFEFLKLLTQNFSFFNFSFVQEFIGDPLDGVTLLLDLLRAIQLSQANNFHNTPGSSATTGKIPPSIQRRALLDELTCLQCLYCCCLRYNDAIRKLTASSAGLFTLAVCIMSNVNKSRIIALQVKKIYIIYSKLDSCLFLAAH